MSLSEPNPIEPIRIGGQVIGDGHPVFVVAEIGYNFRTLEEGKASIDAAVEAGADAVKVQTFKAETVTSRRTDFPAEAGSTNQFDEFARYEISEDTHRVLFDHARTRGVLAFSTPSYYDDVDLLERLAVPAHKIGSDDLTNLPFLRYVGARNKPVIFSTGMGTMAEVAEAVACLRETGNDQVVVLQCVSNYPVRNLRMVNLRVIDAYRRAFGLLVGFSDHTTSVSASVGAVALGACVIEKHFTLDKRLPVPDAQFSADPAEFGALVTAIREVEQALGDGLKRPMQTEQAMRQETRKSAIARRTVRAGDVLGEGDIIVKRPGIGVAPALVRLLVGRRAKRTIEADEVITWDMVE